MQSLEELIQELQELDAKATPAPWHSEMGIVVDNFDETKARRVFPVNYDANSASPNSDLAVAMRNALPRILARLQHTPEPQETNEIHAAKLLRGALSKLQRVYKRATPGPWEFGDDGEIWGPDETRVATPTEYGRTKQEADANGELIAGMQNLFADLMTLAVDLTLVPGLELANRQAHQSIARLKAKIKKLEEELKHARDT